MSHASQRTEKDCLNCGQTVAGRFCQHCGQENIEPVLSTWGLIHHFFSDLVHFDGKYFATIRTLFTQPGYLSQAYMRGRRVAFVDPAKMYIFTAAVFFFVLYTFFLKVDEEKIGDSLTGEVQTPTGLVKDLNEYDPFKSSYRLVNGFIVRDSLDTLVQISDRQALQRFRDSVVRVYAAYYQKDSLKPSARFILIPGITELENRLEYDSLQAALPSAAQDGWFKRFMAYRQFAIQEHYKGEPGLYIAHVLESFLHSFATILFITLPLLALLLKLLYLRRKHFYYVHHGIFLIHTYIHTYLVLLLYFGVNALQKASDWGVWGWIKLLLAGWLFWYLYRSMRVFYGQSRHRTVFKMFLFLLFGGIVTTLVFGAYFVYTILKG